MLELLFLLLPIAAGYGWYMGRRSIHQDNQRQSNHLSRQYVAGLNYLLADQSDKAVEHFLELLDVDDDTLETHLSLGNLFRQRGEVDRSIKIHQHILTRPLTREQKQLALQELARDFLAAGFLDRAEKLWLDLAVDADFEETALAQLVLIYEKLRDWEQALNVGERLLKLQGSRWQVPLSHFCCELAEQAIRDENYKQAQQWLRKASSLDKLSVRASMLKGDLAFRDGDSVRAVKEWGQIFEQDCDFAGEVLPRLVPLYQQLGQQEELRQRLQKALELRSSGSLTVALAKIVANEQGNAVAQNLVLDQLRRHPSMRSFAHLIELQLAVAEAGAARESLELLQALVSEQMKVKATHRCRHCGFSIHSLLWHCPSCRHWGTIKPIRGLDGE